MAFTLAGSLNPNGGPLLRSQIIANSVVVQELESLTVDVPTAGFLNLGVTGQKVFGHAKALVARAGVGLETDGSTGAATGSFIGTFTASSTNQTVAQTKAQCDISKETLYSADPDAAIGIEMPLINNERRED